MLVKGCFVKKVIKHRPIIQRELAKYLRIIEITVFKTVNKV